MTTLYYSSKICPFYNYFQFVVLIIRNLELNAFIYKTYIKIITNNYIFEVSFIKRWTATTVSSHRINNKIITIWISSSLGVTHRIGRMNRIEIPGSLLLTIQMTFRTISMQHTRPTIFRVYAIQKSLRVAWMVSTWQTTEELTTTGKHYIIAQNISHRTRFRPLTNRLIPT